MIKAAGPFAAGAATTEGIAELTTLTAGGYSSAITRAMATWEKQKMTGPTPNGGAMAEVLSDRAAGTTVITEYDSRGFVIFRFEYQRVDPATLSHGNSIVLTITDWDDQVVEQREISAFPDAGLASVQLSKFMSATRSSWPA